VNFRHLEVFYAVMINGTVTAAARQLGVTQPSVTTTLQQAESRLGVQLFQRESGRLIPTEEAHILFDEASRAHEALSAVSILAKNLELGRGGHVRVASVPSLAIDLLPDAIEMFEKRLTGFQYSVTTLNTEEIIDQLDTRKGTFNLGLTFGVPPESSLASTDVGEVDIFAVLPGEWGVAPDKELDLKSLADRPFVAGFDGTALGTHGRELFLNADVEPRVVARSHTHQLAGALVQRGLGYALLDSLTVLGLLRQGADRTVTISRLPGSPTLPVVAAYPSQRRLSNAASAFIECFQQAFEVLQQRTRGLSAPVS